MLNSSIVVVFLQCCEPGSTIVLRTSATLLVAKVLAGVGSEQALACQQIFRRLCDECMPVAYQRARHSRSFASSWTGCLAPEMALPVQQAPEVGH